MASNPSFPIGTASVSWTDSGGTHLRVYVTDGYNVTERCFDNNAWTTGGFSAKGGQVSATVWQESEVRIRVYCTFEDACIEYCSDGGGAWYQGGFTVS